GVRGGEHVGDVLRRVRVVGREPARVRHPVVLVDEHRRGRPRQVATSVVDVDERHRLGRHRRARRARLGLLDPRVVVDDGLVTIARTGCGGGDHEQGEQGSEAVHAGLDDRHRRRVPGTRPDRHLRARPAGQGRSPPGSSRWRPADSRPAAVRAATGSSHPAAHPGSAPSRASGPVTVKVTMPAGGAHGAPSTSETASARCQTARATTTAPTPGTETTVPAGPVGVPPSSGPTRPTRPTQDPTRAATAAATAATIVVTPGPFGPRSTGTAGVPTEGRRSGIPPCGPDGAPGPASTGAAFGAGPVLDGHGRPSRCATPSATRAVATVMNADATRSAGTD